jgi:hypothetical protein
VQHGYQCEECEEAVWVASTPTELTWLLRRQHLVREVARHLTAGLDGWMDDGLAFLAAHEGHSITVVRRPSR